jgi:transposase
MKVIDATGVTVRNPGPWLRQRTKDGRRARFVKLHAAIDQQTGEFLAVEVTPASGKGTRDASVGPRLIAAAAKVSEEPRGVLADRAYDTRECYRAARRVGCALVTVPKDNAVPGLHPDRDAHLEQIGRLGPPKWKKRKGYGQRSQVESGFSALKRVMGDRVRATSFEGAVAEIMARVALYNAMLVAT